MRFVLLNSAALSNSFLLSATTPNYIRDHPISLFSCDFVLFVVGRFLLDNVPVWHCWLANSDEKTHISLIKQHKGVSPKSIRAERSQQETFGPSDPFSIRSYRTGSFTPFAAAPSDKPSGGTRKLVRGSESTRLSRFQGAHVGQPLPLPDAVCSSEVDRAL